MNNLGNFEMYGSSWRVVGLGDLIIGSCEWEWFCNFLGEFGDDGDMSSKIVCRDGVLIY